MYIPFIAYTQRVELKAVLDYELYSITGNRPVVYDKFDEFKSFVDLFPRLSFILIDSTSKAKELNDFVQVLVNSPEKYEHIIVLDSHLEDGSQMKSFGKNDFIGLFSYLKELLNVMDHQIQDWMSIPISALNHFNHLPFDLYIKLSHQKFVRRIKAFEEIDESLVENFKRRGIQDIYFAKEHNKEFSKLLINNLIHRVDFDFSDGVKQLKARCEVFQTTKELIHSLGLAPKIMDVCENMVLDLTRNILIQENDFSLHLSRIKQQSEFSFHYRLIELTSYLGAHLLSAIEVPQYVEKLKLFVWSAFFADMTLMESESIHHLNDEFQKDYERLQDNEILTHAWKAARLISEQSMIPSEVVTIIKQHHGSIEGVGFPEHKKSSRLLLISKCLIITQELAYKILTNPQLSMLEVLKITTKHHPEATSLRLIKVFENLFAKESSIKAS